MNILVLGNLGDIGPALLHKLAEHYGAAALCMLDHSDFARCHTVTTPVPGNTCRCSTALLRDERPTGNLTVLDRCLKAVGSARFDQQVEIA